MNMTIQSSDLRQKRTTARVKHTRAAMDVSTLSRSSTNTNAAGASTGAPIQSAWPSVRTLETQPGIEVRTKPSASVAMITHAAQAMTSHGPCRVVADGEARVLIPPTPRPCCSLAPSITTPLYRTTVSRALGQPLPADTLEGCLPASATTRTWWS